MTILAELMTGPTGLLLRATLVLLAAVALDRMLRGGAALSRHILWAVTGLALLALPVLQLRMPRLPIPVWRMPVVETVVVEQVIVGMPVGPMGPAREGVGPSAAREAPIGSLDLDLDMALTLTWVLGALLIMAAVGRGVWRARRLADRAVPVRSRRLVARLEHCSRLVGLRRRVALRVAEGIRSPMTGGIWRPVVLLPMDAADWTDSRLDTVLCHELVHVRRVDAFHQLVARVMVAVYWFHPLAWHGAHRAAAARESACDEAVLGLGARPSHYARHLVDLAEHGMAMPSMPALARIHHPDLEDRVMAILRYPPAPLSSRRTAIAVSVLLLWTALVAAARPATAQRPAEPVIPPAPAAPGLDVVASVPLEPPRRPAMWRRADVPVPPPLSPTAPPPTARPPAGPGPDCSSTEGLNAGLPASSRAISYVLSDGGRACLAVRGPLDDSVSLSPLGRLPGGVAVVLAADVADMSERLVIRGTANGNRHEWSVNGETRPFDAAATEWRDAMLALLDRDHSGELAGAVRVGAARAAERRAELMVRRVDDMVARQRTTERLASVQAAEQARLVDIARRRDTIATRLASAQARARAAEQASEVRVINLARLADSVRLIAEQRSGDAARLSLGVEQEMRSADRALVRIQLDSVQRDMRTIQLRLENQARDLDRNQRRLLLQADSIVVRLKEAEHRRGDAVLINPDRAGRRVAADSVVLRVARDRERIADLQHEILQITDQHLSQRRALEARLRDALEQIEPR